MRRCEDGRDARSFRATDSAAFRELHPDDKPEDDYSFDAFEIAHADVVYHAILDGLAQALDVRRLNGRDVVEAWNRVLGES